MRESRMAMLVAAAMLFATPVFGQGISVGVKGGAAFATVSSDQFPDASNKTGLSLGATASLGLAPMFAIQPEVLLVQKGAEIDIAGTTVPDVSGSYNVSYLQIPLLAKISLPTPGSAKPFLYVGPAISIETGCSVSAEADGISADMDCDADGLSTLARKSTDFSAVGGAGLGVGMGPGEFSLEARYDLGLTSISDVAETDLKNRAFTVLAGFSFQLGL